ncbi:serine/threonine protein kinase [Stigmatella hybrida]|uniref:serine/threonine protein kinase n=1 Tax=Stigmatella hybrida TaxID=394097 RepID=UPI001CDAAB00|nr:serine/threonine-protein kinase [Stigmatella hybrida]
MRGRILKGHRGQYVIKTQIGEGGVGTVFKAQSIETGQDCAVKVLHSKRFELTDAQKRRFEQEIEATCQGVKSPYIVAGIDFGSSEGTPFLVMEWMPGGTLLDLIASDKPINQPQAIAFITQLLKGYRDLRQHGYIHRDIKPNNVLLTEDQRLKLSDLGVAKSPTSTVYLTGTGTQIGSLLYISERQRTDPEKASPQDDFYALCLVMYELATRRRIHISNPRLAYLQPSTIPGPLALLIDKGMQDTSDWQTAFEAMCHYLDLERECIQDNYEGSLLVPHRLIERRRQAVTKKLFTLCQNMDLLHEDATEADWVADEPHIINDVVRIITDAYEECASEFEDAGVYVTLTRAEHTLLTFSAGFDETTQAAMEELDIYDKIFDGRFYGWLSLHEREDGAVFLSGIGSKRLDADESHMPPDAFSRAFDVLSDENIAFLRSVGRALAVGVALGALNWLDQHLDWYAEEQKGEPDDD